WRTTYSRRLVMSDTLAVVWVVFAVQLLRFGFDPQQTTLAPESVPISLSYTLISLSIIVSWVGFLGAFKTRDHRVVGSGVEEYKRVADASVRLFGVLAIVAFLLKLDL